MKQKSVVEDSKQQAQGETAREEERRKASTQQPWKNQQNGTNESSPFVITMKATGLNSLS